MNKKETDVRGRRNQSTWIFQANPAKYRIGDSLRFESEEYWNLNQHAKDVAVGDRVLIWISGPEAGIYALGTIVSPAATMSDSPEGIGYWVTKEEGKRAKPRVRVRYDRVLLERPVLKDFLKVDPELRELGVIRAPRGTNFAVTASEWGALQEWLQ